MAIFSDHERPEQCPDCGKFTVRPATEAEVRELRERDNKEKMWGSSN